MRYIYGNCYLNNKGDRNLNLESFQSWFQ